MRNRNLLIDPYRDNGPIAGSQMSSLLVLDDSPDWGQFVSAVAEEAGFDPTAVTGYREFLDAYKAEPPDIMVLDIFMPQKDGIEIIRDIAKLDNRPFIILMSGQADFYLDTASKLGRANGLDVIGTLNKPFRLDDLRELLEKGARLVQQKNRLAGEAIDSRLPQPLTTSFSDATTDQGPARPDTPCKIGNAGSVAETNKRVNDDIKKINNQFCLILWSTQLAALNELGTVPSALVEAATSLIVDRAGTDKAAKWKCALHLHLQTLTGNKALIRKIADVHQLQHHGRSAAESIGRINMLACEFIAVKSQGASSKNNHARLRELTDENDKLKRTLYALSAAVTKAVTLASGGVGPTDPQELPRGNSEERDTIVLEFPKKHR